MSEFEEYIKARFPVDYESLKEKYPDIPIGKFYGDEEDIWDFQQTKINALQGRISKVVDMLEGDLSYVEEDRRCNFDFLQMAMIRCLKDDLKALRGERE